MIDLIQKTRNNTFYNLNFTQPAGQASAPNPNPTPAPPVPRNVRINRDGSCFYNTDPGTGDGKGNNLPNPPGPGPGPRQGRYIVNHHNYFSKLPKKKITPTPDTTNNCHISKTANTTTNNNNSKNNNQKNEPKLNTTENDVEKIYNTSKYLLYGGGRTLSYDDAKQYSYYKNPRHKENQLLQSCNNNDNNSNCDGIGDSFNNCVVQYGHENANDPKKSTNGISQAQLSSISYSPRGSNPNQPNQFSSAANQYSSLDPDANRKTNNDVAVPVPVPEKTTKTEADGDASADPDSMNALLEYLCREKGNTSIVDHIYKNTALDPKYQTSLQSLMNKYYGKTINSLMSNAKKKSCNNNDDPYYSTTVPRQLSNMYKARMMKVDNNRNHNSNYIGNGLDSNSNSNSSHPAQKQNHYIAEDECSYSNGNFRIKANSNNDILREKHYIVDPLRKNRIGAGECEHENDFKGSRSNRCSSSIQFQLPISYGLRHLYEINKETDRPHPADADVQKYLMPFHTSETHASYKNPQHMITKMRNYVDTENKNMTKKRSDNGSAPPHSHNLNRSHSPTSGIPIIPRLTESQASYQNPYLPRKLPLGYPDKNTLNSVRYPNSFVEDVDGDGDGDGYDDYDYNRGHEVPDRNGQTEEHDHDDTTTTAKTTTMKFPPPIIPLPRPPFLPSSFKPKPILNLYNKVKNFPEKIRLRPRQSNVCPGTDLEGNNNTYTCARKRSSVGILLGGQQPQYKKFLLKPPWTNNTKFRTLEPNCKKKEIDCSEGEDNLYDGTRGSRSLTTQLQLHTSNKPKTDIEKADEESLQELEMLNGSTNMTAYDNNHNAGDTLKAKPDYLMYDMDGSRRFANNSNSYLSRSLKNPSRTFDVRKTPSLEQMIRNERAGAGKGKGDARDQVKVDPVQRYIAASYIPSDDEEVVSLTKRHACLKSKDSNTKYSNPYQSKLGVSFGKTTERKNSSSLQMSAMKSKNSTRPNFSYTNQIFGHDHRLGKESRDHRQLKSLLSTRTQLHFTATDHRKIVNNPRVLNSAINHTGHGDFPGSFKILLYCTKGIVTIPSPTDAIPDCNTFSNPKDLISFNKIPGPSFNGNGRVTFSVNMEGFLDEDIYLFMDSSKRKIIIEGRRPKRGAINARQLVETIDLPDGVEPDNLRIARDYLGILHFEQSWIF